MRKELKIIGSRDRHVFTATFIRFGFRDGYKGYRNDVFDRPIEKDYRLSRPTKIKKIGKKSID